MYSTKGQYKSISINSVQQSENTLKINLLGDSDSAKLYLLYSNYLTEKLSDFALQILRTQEKNRPQPINFSKTVNKYLKSRVLDEEYRYILDRKTQKAFVGNTLPRPQILMKRAFLGETDNETQIPMKGSEFDMLDDIGYARCGAAFGGAHSAIKPHLHTENSYYDFLDIAAK